jgi:hypothetical protein
MPSDDFWNKRGLDRDQLSRLDNRDSGELPTQVYRRVRLATGGVGLMPVNARYVGYVPQPRPRMSPKVARTILGIIRSRRGW